MSEIGLVMYVHTKYDVTHVLQSSTREPRSVGPVILVNVTKIIRLQL